MALVLGLVTATAHTAAAHNCKPFLLEVTVLKGPKRGTGGCTYIYIYTRAHMYFCVYICIYIYSYIYVYSHIHARVSICIYTPVFSVFCCFFSEAAVQPLHTSIVGVRFYNRVEGCDAVLHVCSSVDGVCLRVHRHLFCALFS